jgi:pectinesterase
MARFPDRLETKLFFIAMRRRAFLAVITALTSSRALEAKAAKAPSESTFDAMVALRPASTLGVPTYRSIAKAIDAAPENSQKPFRIRISAGIWHEKLVITKPFVHLIGADRHRSVIQFDAAAGQADPDGKIRGTWGCATLRVRAADFSMRNLTIANTFDYLGNLRKPQFEKIGANGAQAVALMLDAGSDRARFDEVDIVGHQDTLFADAGRSLFQHCRISGSVDFVFGAGQAVFDACDLVSRYRPDKQRQGYIAAPSTSRQQAHGLNFLRCRLLREALVPAHSVVLGRAWRPTREFADGRYGDPDALGAAAFIDCWMADHIAAEGWDAMNTTTRDGRRIPLEPHEVRLCEYANRGPGARIHATRHQLSAQQAGAYATGRLLDDWVLPARRE